MQCLVRRWWVWTAALLCLGVLGIAFLLIFDRRHRPTMEEFRQIEWGMDPAKVEAILGPPHRVLTAESKAETEVQALYTPGPDDVGKKVYYYEGPMEKRGQYIRFFVVRFDKEGQVSALASGSHPNRAYPWGIQRWLRNNVLGI